MDMLTIIFVGVVVVALMGVGYIFYQQIFQHPMGKGKEIRGISDIGDYPLSPLVISGDVNSDVGASGDGD